MSSLKMYLGMILLSLLLLNCGDDDAEEDDNVNPVSPEFELVITTNTLEEGTVGVAYSQELMAAGGDGSYLWSIASGALPEGLNLNPNTGEINGTPTEDKVNDFLVMVSSAGETDSKAFQISIEQILQERTIRSAIVNVDFQFTIDPTLEAIYEVDNGIYSSPGGNLWNAAESTILVEDCEDEFGGSTSVDMNVFVTGATFIGAATNELQDTGISTAGIPEQGFEWQELVADSLYNLAFYVYGEIVLEATTKLDVTHADGVTTLELLNECTWTMPGDEGEDYLLLENVKPFEISPGNYGFRIDNINDRGVVMGAQLVGAVYGLE